MNVKNASAAATNHKRTSATTPIVCRCANFAAGAVSTRSTKRRARRFIADGTGP